MITVNLIHASWCQPCKQFEPVFDVISKDSKYKNFEFRTYDVDEDPGFEICEKYHVKSVPTTLVLNDEGEELYKIMGNAPKNDVTKILDIVIERENNKENVKTE